MCQPPEISLPNGEGIDAACPNDGWSGPSDGWASPDQGATWANEGVQEHNNSMNTLAAQEQTLLLKYGQQQQLHRAAQLAAMASPQQLSWGGGFPSNLTEKLQRAAAAATGAPMVKPAGQADATSSLSWLARAQPSPFAPQAPAGWPSSAPMGMPTLAPTLVAQGIPMGLAHLAHIEQMGYGQHQEHEDEDDKDPKKYKRMMSNRASAKRSRQRRQERLDELEIVSAKLQVENATVQRRLNEANDRIRKFQEENDSLQVELKQLKEMVDGRGMAIPPHLSPSGQPGTNQDSCGNNGSTTDHPSSDPSSTPSNVSAKRLKRDEAAESRFQESAEHGSAANCSSANPSPVTPSSAVTSSDSEKAAAPEMAVPVIAHEIEVLDDDLFTSFMEECFEAKPLGVQ